MLILVVLIWPAEEKVQSRQQIPTQKEANTKHTAPASSSISPSIAPAKPSIQLLQPDPGMSEDELFRQAVNARKCRDVPKTKAELDNWRTSATANNAPSERIARVLNAFEPCQGIDAAYDYMTSFKLLAQQGHEQAVWQFWQLTEEEVLRLKGIQNADTEAIIAARKDFQLSKYQLAEQQLLLGSERAMMRLMSAYRYLDPNTDAQNFIRSLALANLVMTLTDNQDNYRRADWHKQLLESRMPNNDIQSASELAEEIAAKIQRP